jgi:uncharacterized membrane protein
MNSLIQLLQTMPVAGENIGRVILLVVSSALAGVGTVWGAFRSDLKDCKEDRQKLFVLLQKVQDENKSQAVRIGQLETTIARMEARLQRMDAVE